MDFHHHPRSAWRSAWLGLLGSLLCLFAACGRNPSQQAFDSNANGYACTSCGQKFYTERSVAAEFCPNCKAAEIEDVMAFVCPDDQQVILAPRTFESAPCPSCRKLVRQVKLPQEAELVAWGASRQEPESVMAGEK